MSVYHPIAEEISASMGVPMEGFFDGAEAVLATPAPPTAHKAPAKTPTPSAERVFMLKGLVRLHPCLLRDLLLQRAPFLPPLFRPRLLLPFYR